MIDPYQEFLESLREFVDEVPTPGAGHEWVEEHDPGTPAAKLGPLADGLVALLAARYSQNEEDRAAMEGMKLDEALAYLGDRSDDHDVIHASRAAAKILAALRWFHYGSFARPSDEEGFDAEEDAATLEAGLERLLGDPDGGQTHG